MHNKFEKLALVVASAGLFTVAGCGGGGGATGTTSSPPAAAVVTGTAATGAALTNAAVTITNSAGNSPCQEASITTTGSGSYTCTLKSGEAAPFFIVVTDPAGQTTPLVSIATSTPAAGTSATINATPLTTAIVAQLATDGQALTVVSSKTVDAAKLQQVITNVIAQLSNVLTAIGAPAGYNPFTTSITAATATATGNTADQILDVVKVVTDPVTGSPALATVDNPVPVVLATATTTGSAVVAPVQATTTVSQAVQVAAQAFNACFALPTAQRVLAKDTTILPAQGGPAVTSVAAACQNIVAETGNAAGVSFLHNGYNGGQLFYNILTSDTMTGAKFSVPEIMAFYPAEPTATPPSPGAYDHAVLNIKYIDANGNPGNVVTVARNIPNTSSATRPTNWWLVGNQQPADVSVRLNIRRVEQLNPTNTSAPSKFQSGIQFSVNASGPGSTSTNGNLNFARISGPGLPGNGAAGTGLVYITPMQTGQGYMDLSNKSGTIPVSSTPFPSNLYCGNAVGTLSPSFNCPNLWFTRTKGVAGTDATTLIANPVNLLWAQAGDNVDTSKITKGTKYKIELFYGAGTTPTYTYYKTLLSDLIPATRGIDLQWNTAGTQTLSALNPAGPLGGALTSLTVDWVQNLAAPQIGGVQVSVDAKGNYSPTFFVSKGATSVVANTSTPALTSTTTRAILFNYRTTDTSNKTSVFTYN